jgi:ADP-ribosyl-[dinitrogen reductase] hydrolase
MASPPRLQSRIRGALLGLAVCDALGGPVEFHPRGTFPLVTSMQPNNNFKLGPGYFTDDTSMALCLAHSLLETYPTSSNVHQASRYLAWYRVGYMSSVGRCFDIGITTRNGLEPWKRAVLVNAKHGTEGSDPDAAKDQAATQAAQTSIEKSFNKECYCGNGSLMRVLPVALLFAADIPRAVRIAAESSRVTHPHPRCVLSCALYTILVSQCLQNPDVTKETLVNHIVEFVSALEDTVVSSKGKSARAPFIERFKPYTDLSVFQEKVEKEIRSTGYVLYSLEAALWTFLTTSSFREGAIKVVNLGDDADTVGAIYGGLAGAFYGDEEIPEDWLRDMKRLDLVEEVIGKIVDVRSKEGGRHNEDKRQDVSEMIAASVDRLGV